MKFIIPIELEVYPEHSSHSLNERDLWTISLHIPVF